MERHKTDNGRIKSLLERLSTTTSEYKELVGKLPSLQNMYLLHFGLQGCYPSAKALVNFCLERLL